MKKTVQPMHNRVVLEQVKKERHEGGIMIAPSGQKSADRATVIAVGPGMLNTDTGKRIPVDLSPGDIVLINAYLGMRATLNGKEVIIQKDEEILGREVSEEE